MQLKNIMNYFNEEDGDQKVCNDLRKSLKPILLYGCSEYSRIIYNFLEENKIDIEAFVIDKQYWKNDFFIENKPVKCIENYPLEKYNIVVAFGDVEKSKLLKNNQKLLKSKFYFLWNPYRNCEWDSVYVKNNWNSLVNVYKGLADEKSRKILYELVISKVNRSCSNRLLEVTDNSHHYFNELTYCPDSRNEIFVDCGAYTGDTIIQYVSFTDRKYKKIYAFEPDSGLMEELRKNIGCPDNIEIINKGVWKEENILEFNIDGEKTRIDDGIGNAMLPVTTIDMTVQPEEKITFIKMDIEGSELEALEGAAKTISRYMPKLAICCYHKREDIFTLFSYISNFENKEMKYNIYLRHHSNSAYETVLYALPIKK